MRSTPGCKLKFDDGKNSPKNIYYFETRLAKNGQRYKFQRYSVSEKQKTQCKNAMQNRKRERSLIG